MKEYMKSIFIFRRDYRLNDNIGLLEALARSIEVIPIFIFTPEQLINNPYKSDNAVQFMVESLDNLDQQLRDKGSKLFYFFGKPNEILNKIIKKTKPDAVYVNRDYTPYSKKRDELLEQVCQKNKINFHSYEDVLLYPVGTVRNGSGDIYTKFTPYFHKARKVKVNDVRMNKYNNYISNKKKIIGEFKGNKGRFYKYNENLAVRGGRTNAMKILEHIEQFKNYNNDHNILSKETTRLSAYIKFGCVSIREVYHKMKDKLGVRNDLIKQLYWREFYYNISEYNPNIFSHDWSEKNFKDNYKKVKWITLNTASDEQKKQWKALMECRSGIPCVDACVKQLITQGFLHNRGRLILGSFIVKNMFFHWAEGEKFFSKWLVDLDLPNNTNNWLWLSGAGADSQIFIRVFNPWIQGLRFDHDCKYIKKWLPQLTDIPNEHIHEWFKYHHLYPNIDYPPPMLDASSTAKKAIEKYKKALYK